MYDKIKTHYFVVFEMSVFNTKNNNGCKLQVSKYMIKL